MAKTNSATRRDDETLRSGDVPDQTVAQVGKAVAQILKLRQTLEEHLATAQTEEERQSLAEEVEKCGCPGHRRQRSYGDAVQSGHRRGPGGFRIGRAGTDRLPGCLIHREE